MLSRFPASDLTFDDVIVVEGKRAGRAVKGTFASCVFENGYAEPLDTDAESGVRTFVVWVRTGDWIERTPPQTGDTIRTADGDCLSVVRLETKFGGVWAMTAKEAAA